MGHLRRTSLALIIVASTLAVMPVPAALAARADQPPRGANDFSCTPPDAHPNPVVLVHGLFANMKENWQYVSPRLADAGYCVFALTYGVSPDATGVARNVGGLIPMEQSAQQLAAFVGDVLEATGASKVDIVGHSEGSLMPNWFVKYLGGADVVDRYVAMTPLWHGTTAGGLATAYKLGRPSGISDSVITSCESCTEFFPDSAFIAAMNAGGIAAPEVTYTTLITRFDELVTPWTSGLLPPGPNVTNIVVQDQCPAHPAEHVAMAFDQLVLTDILNALDPTHPRPIRCGVGPVALQRA